VDGSRARLSPRENSRAAGEFVMLNLPRAADRPHTRPTDEKRSRLDPGAARSAASEELIDEGLEETFPASDPPSLASPTRVGLPDRGQPF
jgi:hypothetical protein